MARHATLKKKLVLPTPIIGISDDDDDLAKKTAATTKPKVQRKWAASATATSTGQSSYPRYSKHRVQEVKRSVGAKNELPPSSTAAR